MTKAAAGAKAFGDSATDRRLGGGDRRVNASDYRYQEFPKAVYHKDGTQSRVVKDQAELDALGGDWKSDIPEVHADEDLHTAAVLKGDGVPLNQNVQKVQIVDTADAHAADFQKPGTATAPRDEAKAAKKPAKGKGK